MPSQPNLPHGDVEPPHALSLPRPIFDAESVPLPQGDVVVFPHSGGREVELHFASPYEMVLVFEGERVTQSTDHATQSLLLWAGRRMLPLFVALDVTHGLRAQFLLDTAVDRGGLESGIIVCDIVDKETHLFVDHATLTQRLASSSVRLPAFALLGETSSRSEMAARVRAMYASGTALEVRSQDGGFARARRRLLVGR